MDITLPEQARIGREMHLLISRLFPICRSITGDGVRETLRILRERIPLRIHEVPSGTPVFDWEVPREWNIHDAYIKDDAGNRVIDFQKSNLHVINGSIPVQTKLAWSELKARLVTLPEHPDWIPYRTCFHQEDWGFCLTHRQFEELDQLGHRQYEVCIDATFEEGSLTYGEFLVPGETEQEVLITTHVCHPSLANDNLSGIAVATYLANHLQHLPCRYSYRFLFIPATIGAITWLSLNEEQTKRIQHGLVLAVLGDAGHSTYKKSRRGNAVIDRAVCHVLKHSGDYDVLEFEPFGYDQRQFCSPGFDLPMGSLMRTPNEQFPEYHTSADNLDLVKPESLADSLAKCVAIVDVLEHNKTYLNQNPNCEPRLGKRGLYTAFGRASNQQNLQRAVLWVLNLSDGKHSLLDIAERSQMEFSVVKQAAKTLQEHDLLKETSPASDHNAKLHGNSVAETNALSVSNV